MRKINIFRWLLILWGCAAVITMGYYAVAWTAATSSPSNNELLEGFAIGLVYGWPSWLGLPIIAFITRHKFTLLQIIVTLLPVLVALVISGVLKFMGAL